MKKVAFLISVCNFWIATLLSAQCVSGDCQNGFGGIIYPNGDKYIGEFKDGLRDGIGVLAYSKGAMQTYEGFFKQNKEDRYGVYTDSEGNIISALLSDGRFSGYCSVFLVKEVISIDEFYNPNGVSVEFSEINQEHLDSRKQHEMLDNLFYKKMDSHKNEIEVIYAKMQ